jgi:hypothetical protein
MKNFSIYIYQLPNAIICILIDFEVGNDVFYFLIKEIHEQVSKAMGGQSLLDCGTLH